MPKKSKKNKTPKKEEEKPVTQEKEQLSTQEGEEVELDLETEDIGNLDDSLISEDLVEEEEDEEPEQFNENLPKTLSESDTSIRSGPELSFKRLESPTFEYVPKEIEVVEKFFGLDPRNPDHQESKKKEQQFPPKEIEIIEKYFGENLHDKEPISAPDSQLDDVWKYEAQLTLEQRRKRYPGQFFELSSIQNWSLYSQGYSQDVAPKYSYNPSINSKVAIWQGDITTLEIDAVVNAANESLLGGGGIDGAIHRAAGRELFEECQLLGGCKTGQTKITRGYQLPAKYVLHTVGPIGEHSELLKSCYSTCLELVKKYNIRSVAFCGVSTGIFGYPLEPASRIALQTVREWLEHEDNRNKVDLIIFCTYLEKEKNMYQKLMPEYFPISPTYKESEQTEESEEEEEEAEMDDFLNAFDGEEGKPKKIIQEVKQTKINVSMTHEEQPDTKNKIESEKVSFTKEKEEEEEDTKEQKKTIQEEEEEEEETIKEEQSSPQELQPEKNQLSTAKILGIVTVSAVTAMLLYKFFKR